MKAWEKAVQELGNYLNLILDFIFYSFALQGRFKIWEVCPEMHAMVKMATKIIFERMSDREGYHESSKLY